MTTSFLAKPPQQIRTVEGINWHLLDQTRAMLFQNKIPKKFLGKSVFAESYLISRSPCVLASKTPMEILFSFYLDVLTSSNLILGIFKCTSFVHVHSDGRWNLDSRALKYLFIGYSSIQKGVESNLVKQKNQNPAPPLH